MISHHKHSTEIEALRSVAIVEFTKGVLVLLAAAGILSLIHRDVLEVADNLLRFLRINPHRHYAEVFLRLADNATDKRLWMIAAAATTYSVLRFFEAYGLWFIRPWAEWIALISGSAYLPFEIRGLLRHPHLLGFAIFFVNLVVVLFMLYRRTFGEWKARHNGSSKTGAS